MAIGRSIALGAFLVLRVAAMSLSPRIDIGEQFHFYVWGNGLPTLNVFYADGAAVFSDYATANKTDNLVPVIFSMDRSLQRPEFPGNGFSGYTFTVRPDTTAPVDNKATRSPPFESATLFVPDRESLFHSVGFLAPDATPAASARTYGFLLGDGFFKVIQSNGLVLLPAYCAFTTATPGVWSLAWNVTAADRQGGFPVTLRLARSSGPLGNIEQNPCRVLP